MRQDIPELTAFHDHESYRIDEPRNRVGIGDPPGPGRHALDRCEQTTHQDKDHHKQKRQRHRLLLRFRIGRDHQAKSQNGHQINGQVPVDQTDIAYGLNPIYQVSHPKYSYSKYHHPQNPERYQFSENKPAFGNRGYVDLIDGPRFFFLYDVERRHIPPDHGHQNYQNYWYHKEWIAKRGIEPKPGLNVDGCWAQSTDVRQVFN